MKRLRFFMPLAIAFVSLAPQAMAQGDLLVTPYRLVFDNTSKTQEITLANTGKDTATYIISLQEKRMNDDGSFTNIKQPDEGQLFASEHIRFFPKKITLAPNKTQMVKVQVIKPYDLPKGEYRSHIFFKAVQPHKASEAKEVTNTPENISVDVIAAFGISIPIIVRSGDLTTNVQLTGASFSSDNNEPKLHVTINRTGNMSVYGVVTVEVVSPDGTVKQAGIVKGVAVYTPNTVRKMEIALIKNSGIDYKSGKIRVTYKTQLTENPKTLAETVIALK